MWMSLVWYLRLSAVTQPSLTGPLVYRCYFLHKQLHAFLREVKRVNVSCSLNFENILLFIRLAFVLF